MSDLRDRERRDGFGGLNRDSVEYRYSSDLEDSRWPVGELYNTFSMHNYV